MSNKNNIDTYEDNSPKTTFSSEQKKCAHQEKLTKTLSSSFKRNGTINLATPNPIKIRFETNPSLLKRYSVSSTPTIHLQGEENSKHSMFKYPKILTTTNTSAATPTPTPVASRVENNNSSNDSLKLNKTWSKNPVRKSSSLYYDSGIGADVSIINQSKTAQTPAKEVLSNYSAAKLAHAQCQQTRKSSTTHRNTVTIRPHMCEKKATLNASHCAASTASRQSLNPKMVKNIYASTSISTEKCARSSSSKLKSSSSFSTSTTSSSVSTSSVASSSSSILSDKVRKKLDSLLKQNNLKIMPCEKAGEQAKPKGGVKGSEVDGSGVEEGGLEVRELDTKSKVNLNRQFSYKKLSSTSVMLNANESQTTFDIGKKWMNESINDVSIYEKKHNYSRADFTPALNRNGLCKGNLVKRKLTMPPPPILNSTTNLAFSNANGNNTSLTSILNSSYSNILSSTIFRKNSFSNSAKNTHKQSLQNMKTNAHSESTKNLAFVSSLYNSSHTTITNSNATSMATSTTTAAKNNNDKGTVDSTINLNYSKEHSNNNLSISNESYYTPEHPIYGRNSKSKHLCICF